MMSRTMTDVPITTHYLSQWMNVRHPKAVETTEVLNLCLQIEQVDHGQMVEDEVKLINRGLNKETDSESQLHRCSSEH